MKIKSFKNTIKWYDEHAEEYAHGVFKSSPLEVMNIFFEYLPEHPVLLDAGCGPGRDCDLMTQKGATVTGIDVSKGLLEQAQKRFPHIPFVQANFVDLPFKNEMFDGIWAHSSLVHLESIADVKKALHEFYRVLKKKGILHVYVREKPPTDEKDLVFDKERFFRYFTQEEMGKYVEEAGFTIKENTLRHRRDGRKGIQWICIFAEK
ncbi:MAG TPA: class I SAM-dependent methyltransferase [Candidatus Saccharimonadales bacterium]|nr:class I SAM-dependent methyltransferase [Candidatus Saccharimonadales bacterium]